MDRAIEAKTKDFTQYSLSDMEEGKGKEKEQEKTHKVLEGKREKEKKNSTCTKNFVFKNLEVCAPPDEKEPGQKF